MDKRLDWWYFYCQNQKSTKNPIETLEFPIFYIFWYFVAISYPLEILIAQKVSVMLQRRFNVSIVYYYIYNAPETIFF